MELTGLTERKFGLTSWKYCASKLTITNQNYLPNMSFPTEFNNKSFFKILKIKERSLLSCDIIS